MRKFLTIVFFVLSFSPLFSQTVTISGKALSYKGKKLSLYEFSDRITYQTRLLAECTVDTNGNFEFSFEVSDTQQIFIDLETTRGFLYVASGEDYRVLLPKYQPVSLEQQLSPYFQPQFIRLFVLNKDTLSLNFVIAKLDKRFNDIATLFGQPGVSRDSLEQVIGEFAGTKVEGRYLQDYVFYRAGLLYAGAGLFGKQKTVDNFFASKEVLWHNPAYFSLFNFVFQDVLNPRTSEFNLDKALSVLRYHDFARLRDSLMKVIKTGDTDLVSLIALKGLYDLFYSFKNLEDDIILLVKNSQSQLSDSNLLTVSRNIYEQITRMRTGYPAPDFKLQNRFGFNKTLKSFRGKFVYLNFCHPQLLGCKEQLPVLERYMQGAPKDFEVVTIIFGLNKQQFKDFLRQHKQYKWTFLYGGDDKTLLRRYNVVAFPTYYLIDPDGNLVLNPAPTPLENFEDIFSKIYKNWHQKHRAHTTKQ